MQKINLDNWQTKKLNVREMAALYGVSIATIWRWTAAGRLPQPQKVGINTTRWDGQAVAAAMESAA